MVSRDLRWVWEGLDLALADHDLTLADPDLALADHDLALADPDLAFPDPDLALTDHDLQLEGQTSPGEDTLTGPLGNLPRSEIERIHDFETCLREIGPIPRHHHEPMSQSGGGDQAVFDRHLAAPGAEKRQELRPTQTGFCFPG